MHKLFVSYLFLLSFYSLSASTIQISGQINRAKPDDVLPEFILLKSFGSAFPKTLDTAWVSKTGSYEFTINLEKPAAYYASIGNQTNKLLLHPSEKKIKVTSEFNNKNRFAVSESKENEAYKLFNDAVQQYEKDIHEVLKSQSTLDTVNTLMKDLIVPYFAELNKIKTNYPKTFAATELSKIKLFDSLPKIIAAKDIRAYFREHYTDKLHFKNEDLLREPTFNETLLSYLIFVSDGTFSPMQKFIERIFDESKESPKIFVYTLRQIFQHFIAKNMEDDLALLATKALADPRIKDNLTLEVQMKDALRVTKDKPMLEVIGTDSSGKDIALSKYVFSNKVTMVVFWEPNCSHCREAMPMLKGFYDKYQNQGLEIFGVNMGEDREKWVEMIKAEKLNWKNVMMQKRSGEKMAAAQYYVLGTPSFVLIGKNGKIIRRFISQSQLETEIQKNL
jgi:protein-disulfide isomerase